ncbi:MAG TPA: hypothetical protein VHS99_15600 [Chloroflexota bacterium]|nr:hypothetical protein [Chloroflexota bacterium]
MDFWVAAIIITAIGCGTGTVITFIDKVFSNKDKNRLRAAHEDLDRARDRIQHQELQLVEMRRQNEQLHKQLEWHAKLLETQDNLMKQLTSGTHSNSSATGAEPARADTSSTVR